MRLFSDAAASIDDPFLRRAYDLALRGVGSTAPNPAVGCVIVSAGEVVGEGYHERAGGPHAEVVALGMAAGRARGATAFVTLEPCAHHGRTPPCTEALLAAGVTRVVAGAADPDPLAAGGAVALRSAGVEVVFAPDPGPFEELTEGWRTYLRSGMPLVRAKVALSLDGRVALAEGVRSAITGSGGGLVTMRLRSRADAVVVGARTAAIDDPALTARTAEGADAPRQPLRVVLCRDSVPASLSLLADGRGPVTLLVPDDAAPETGLPDDVGTVRYDRAGGVRSALGTLAEETGVRDLLVEPGGRLFTALLTERALDELVLVHAGGFAGGGAPGICAGGESDPFAQTTSLERWFTPVEAGIVEESAVTVWRPQETARTRA